MSIQHRVQHDVEEFHRALEIPVGDSPAIRRPELRAELIREEARETVEAIEAGDLVAAIDGLCDLLCVTYGAAVEFGIDLAPFWAEVHRTNMAKVGGPVRGDGKRLKPEGWTPPRIAELLASLCACGHHHDTDYDGGDVGCRHCECSTWTERTPEAVTSEAVSPLKEKASSDA